ncbi:MAG: hypothetical protein E7458_03845 [Ruminococcaceae bacterium]|nr:hypothetical protein [Oscillospiraceae bacterium]
MKKILLALILSIMMVVSMLPMTAMAAGVECTDESCAHEAAIDGTHYDTLAEAITAASAGNTITFLTDITEDVTVKKNLTIDGTEKNYTGTMTLEATVIIQNVNFIQGRVLKSNSAIKNITIKDCNFDGKGLNVYAVELRYTGSIVIENCTAKNYGYGFLQVPKSNDTISVKNVEISDVNYGLKIDYSNNVTLENVNITNCEYYGIYNSNHGSKTIRIKDSSIGVLGTWDRNTGKTTTYIFEGSNTVDEFDIVGELDILKLADVNSTLTAPEGQNISIDDAQGKIVAYGEGKYKLIDPNEEFTITFKNGENVIATITGKYGTEITAPAGPAMTGHTFIGWDEEIPETMPAENMTLTACWSVNTYTISFDTKGAGSIASIPVKYGTPITDLPTPFRQGYEFTGWLGIPADGVMPAANITLTATWRQTYFQIDTVKPVTPVTPVTPVVPSEPEVDDDSCDGKLSSGCAAATFADLDTSAWYHDAVDYVLENGLMQGVGGGKFAPYTTTSRAMIVTILYRLEGEPAVTGANPFADVENDEWYTDAVLWAAENEIVLGYDGEFFPTDDVTLEQALLILQRYVEYKGADEITVPMIAPYEYNTWAEAGVVWAYLNDILEIGTDLDDLTAPATRAELAGFLYAFCK